jgi:transcription elongation GreA/GreB family factor
MIAAESSTLIKDRNKGLSRLADPDKRFYSLPTRRFCRFEQGHTLIVLRPGTGWQMLDAGIDKRMLLAALIAQVEAKLEELRAGYGAARDAVLSTPHVMKSKREVFGQESAYLANALALNIQEREHELGALRSTRLPETSGRVALGSLVGVADLDGSVEGLYLILPVCGGMELPCGDTGRTVRVLTPAAPMARTLLGKSVGDEVALPTTPPRTAVVRLLV